MLCWRSICFVVRQREKKKKRNSTVSKNAHDMFHIVPVWMFFTVQSSTTSDLPTHLFFCSGSTHRPLVLTHLSLPQMQPFFHYPSVTGVRSLCAARLLSRSCVPWRHAPNKIWVRLKNPNFFFCVPVTHLPAGGVLSFLVSYWLPLEHFLL